MAELVWGIDFDTSQVKQADREIDELYDSIESGSKKAQRKIDDVADEVESLGKRTEKASGKISSALKKVGGFDVGPALKKAAIGVGALGAAFSGAFALGLREAVEAERTLAELAAGARAAGVRDVPAFTRSMSDLAFQLQRTTGVSQDVIQSNQAMALSLGVPADRIGQLSEAAVNMAAALNIDVKTAFEQLGRTVSGELGRVGMFIPELKEIDKAALQAGRGIEIAAEKFRGIAEGEAQTLEGQLRIAKEQLADLAETFVIGAGGTNNMRDSVAELNDMMDRAFPIVESLGQSFGGAVKFAFSMAEGIAELSRELGEFITRSKNLPEAAGGMRDLVNATEDLDRTKRRMQEIRAEIKKLQDAGLNKRIIAGGDEVSIEGLVDEYRLLGQRAKGTASIIENLKSRQDELVGATKRHASASREVNVNIKGLEGGIRGAVGAAQDLEAASAGTAKSTKATREAVEAIGDAVDARNSLLRQQRDIEEQIRDLKEDIATNAVSEVDATIRIAGLLDQKETATERIRFLEEQINNLLEARPDLHRQATAAAQERLQGAELVGKLLGGGESIVGGGGPMPALPGSEGAAGQAAGVGAGILDESGAGIGMTPEQSMFDKIAQQEGYAEALQKTGMAWSDLTKNQQEAHKAEIKHQHAVERGRKLQGMFTGALQQAAAGFVQMAIAGEISMKKLVHGVAKALAQEAAVQAVMELALGFAALGRALMGDTPAAAAATAHFKSAAIFGAVAGVAAAAAAATKPSESGGQQSASSGQAGGGGGIASQTDRADDARSQAPGREVRIVFNDGTFVGTDKERLSRELAPMIEEAVRESGGREG